MVKDYERMTDTELIHEFCGRVPDLYMDLLEIAQRVGHRRGIINLLRNLDADDKHGRRGPLRRLPWTNEDS